MLRAFVTPGPDVRRRRGRPADKWVHCSRNIPLAWFQVLAERRGRVIAKIALAFILATLVLAAAIAIPVLRSGRIARDVQANTMLPDKAIAQLGGRKAAVGRLASYLHSPRWLAPYKNGALLLLIHCGQDSRAASVVIRCLMSTDDGLQRETWRLLYKAPETEGTAAVLIAALQDERIGMTRRMSIVALVGQIGPAARDAVPILESYRDGPNEWLRFKASCSLWPITRDARHILDIASALHGPDVLMSLEAADVLGRIGSEAKGVIPDLECCLRHDDERVRLHAAFALWQITGETTKVLPKLVGFLDSENSSIRSHAVYLLMLLGFEAEKAVPALEEALNDTNGSVRDLAALALRKIRGWAHSEEKPKDGKTPDPAPKSPAPPAPQGVEEPGQDAP